MDQDLDSQSRSSPHPASNETRAAQSSASELKIPSPEICVICLELLADAPHHAGTNHRIESHKDESKEVATANPCRHAQFHLSCLGTWLSHSPTCPLCKTAVASVSVRRNGSIPELITLPSEPSSRPTPRPSTLPSNRRPLPRRLRPIKDPITTDPILTFRRQLYMHQIPSSYLGRGIVGTRNSSNHHQPRRRPLRQSITPASFSQSHSPNAATLVRLATVWIRRELQLFDFLQPSNAASLSHPSNATIRSNDNNHNHSTFPTPSRRTTPHYLLPFILSVVQQIDLRGSAGQAVELIGEYLGREVATLFCHELHAFLSSGAESVGEWDGRVQYWFEGEGELRDGRGYLSGRVDV